MTNPPPEFPTRAEIRATATKIYEQIRLAPMEGKNPRQVALDLRDEQAKYAAALGHENAQRYLDMLWEEEQAISKHAVYQQKQVDEARQMAGLVYAAKLLGVFALVIVLLLAFRACS